MQNGKFSQFESGLIVKYFRNEYSLNISDLREFAAYEPQDVIDYMKETFGQKVTLDEIKKAARV